MSEPTPPAAAPDYDPEFLALLACPLCPERPPLRYDRAGAGSFTCTLRGHVFPVTDGFPDLRPVEAAGAAAAAPAPGEPAA